MPAPKGTRPPAAGKGRPKGARNKLTRDIREMIRAALDKAGGIAYLVKQAELNPTAFMSLLGKMIPTQIDATIKRELPEMSRDELLALLGSARAAAPNGRGGESPQVAADVADVTAIRDDVLDPTQSPLPGTAAGIVRRHRAQALGIADRR